MRFLNDMFHIIQWTFEPEYRHMTTEVWVVLQVIRSDRVIEDSMSLDIDEVSFETNTQLLYEHGLIG